MKIIQPQNWFPSNDLILEENALDVVKSTNNTLVLAGPGAGKTEMLAQRASYLLETNNCDFPRKILAISFKRDACYNLNERVEKRCGNDLAKRFDSLTFDSFAKEILDRFKEGLPKGINVSDQYEIITDDRNIFEIYLNGNQVLNYSIEKKKTMDLHNERLPLDFGNLPHKNRKAVWFKMLEENPSKLSFPMIMRLAELIIKTNPKVKKYLQMTYQYVFLDEFQDTTDIQYDLFKSCFLGSSSVLTAVGDDKQRIMLWAGAREAVFQDFISDTGARSISLHMNFRSAPRIVKLLNYFSQNLLGKNDIAIASPRWEEEDGECYIWSLNNSEQEKQELLIEVKNWIERDNIEPREICILIKQQLSVYAGEIIDYFCENGVRTRNEDYFQEILTEEISLFFINMLYRCVDNLNDEARKQTFDFISNVNSDYSNQKLLNTERVIHNSVKKARNKYYFNNLTDVTYKELFLDIWELIDITKLNSKFPKYNREYLNKVLKKLYDEFWKIYQTTYDLNISLDTLIGKDTIPVMTIHKSKGLEYHTVVFIGLEDRAFWTYNSQASEDNCAFFVALSRAKERVIFTFSKTRPDKYNKLRQQYFHNIKPIIETLSNSKIVVEVDKTS